MQRTPKQGTAARKSRLVKNSEKPEKKAEEDISPVKKKSKVGFDFGFLGLREEDT